MGACCGGMKTSQQHKSLPEKNKAAAAAAAAANEQQLNNDAVAVKNATLGVEGEEAQLNDVDEQQEVATKTTSLETCPSVPLKQNGTQPDALHVNHVDAELQQQPDVQQVEEPDLLVALQAASVLAEAPVVGVEEPEVAVSEDLVEAVATNVDLVACEPPSTGDDAGNEEVGVDTIQLRISEDGDLERSAAAETSTVQADDSVVVQEGCLVTESTRSVVVATSISESEVTPEKSDTISIPISQEQKTEVDVTVVDEQIRPMVEERVEAAVPYQPETALIEEAAVVETSSELPAVPTVDCVTQESTDKVPQEVPLEEVPVTQSETVIEQPAAAAAAAVIGEPHTVVVDEELPPPAEVQPQSAPEVSTGIESVEAEAALGDVPVVEEYKSTSLVADDSAAAILSEQIPQPPVSVDGELQTEEEDHPLENVTTEDLAEPVDVVPPVQAEEPAESVTTVTADSVAVTVTPEAAVDAPIDAIVDENQLQQSLVGEAIHTEAVLETAPEVVSQETTSEPVPITAEEQVTVQGNEEDRDQRLVEPGTQEQPETLIEEIPAQVDEVTTDINAPTTPIQQAEAPLQADTEPAAHEFIEANAQVGNVQSEDGVPPEPTTTADQTPVSSDDTVDQSLLPPPPPPPAETEFLSDSVEREVEQQAPVIIDQADDALPPPPPAEELSIEQQVTPAATADEPQEPASSGVADDREVTTALGDSGVSLAVYSPDDSTVSPTGSEDSSSSVAADNASPSEIPSSATLPSSQEAPILSEA